MSNVYTLIKQFLKDTPILLNLKSFKLNPYLVNKIT
jgi:hypothetical protein